MGSVRYSVYNVGHLFPAVEEFFAGDRRIRTGTRVHVLPDRVPCWCGVHVGFHTGDEK